MADPSGAPAPVGPEELLRANREWARRRETEDPDYFSTLARGQSPTVFFVGCSDSRVPPAVLTGAEPGQLFVHRNVANQLPPDDPGTMAALEFALLGLGVRHVVVCGHHGCGGVGAALSGDATPAVVEWVAPLRALADEQEELLDSLGDDARAERLSELNVLRQVEHVRQSEAFARSRELGRAPELHAWIVELERGRIRPL